MLQIKPNASGIRQSLGRQASSNARVVRAAAATKNRKLSGSALLLGVAGLGVRPAFAEEVADEVKVTEDRPLAETAKTEFNDQSISPNPPSALEAEAEKLIDTLAGFTNNFDKSTTSNTQDKDVSYLPSTPVDVVAQAPVPEAEVASPETPSTLADQSISPAPIEEATPIEKDAESQIDALPTFTESSAQPIDLQQEVAFVPEPAVQVAGLPQTSQEVENPQAATIATEKAITPQESLGETTPAEKEATDLIESLPTFTETQAVVPEPAATQPVAFVPEVVSEAVAVEPTTVAVAPGPAAGEAVAFVSEVVSEAVAVEPTTVAAAPEPAAVDTVAFVPAVVSEAVAVEPTTVVVAPEPAAVEAAAEPAAELVAVGLPQTSQEVENPQPATIATEKAITPQESLGETTPAEKEATDLIESLPTFTETQAAVPEPAAVQPVAFVPDVVPEADAVAPTSTVVENPSPVTKANEEAIAPSVVSKVEKEATDLIESLPTFTETQAVAPEPTAVQPVAFVPDVVPEAVAVAPTSAEVENPSPVTKANEEAIAPSVVSKVEKEATDLIQNLPNFTDNKAPAQPTTAADQQVKAEAPATTAAIEEPAAPTQVAPTFLGFTPVEIFILSLPIVVYSIFSVYRNKVNPKANVSDLLLIVAALLILGNIGSIVFLKVRFF